MANCSSSARGNADGEDDHFQENEASDASETIENIKKEVTGKVPRVNVKNCDSLLRPSKKTAMGIASKQIPGIKSLSKTPKQLKVSRAEMKRRRENPTPKPRRQKKSTGGPGFFHRNRNIPNPEERTSTQERMADIEGHHQTKGNIIGGTWHHKFA